MTVNYITFPSLKHGDKYGYEFHNEWGKYWEQTRRAGACFFVNHRAGMFETYGDGNVKHSPDVPVPKDMLGDYCLSLAKYLLDHPEYRQMVTDCLRNCLCDFRKWRQLIPFYHSLRYDEKKPYRYYSVDSDSYCKVSASESKRHDKRWNVIPTNADGSAEFIWNQLVTQDSEASDGALVAYCARRYFSDLCSDLDVWVSQSAGEYLGLTDRSCRTWNAVRGLQAIVKSTLALGEAESCVENLIRSMERDREEAVA